MCGYCMEKFLAIGRPHLIDGKESSDNFNPQHNTATM